MKTDTRICQESELIVYKDDIQSKSIYDRKFKYQRLSLVVVGLIALVAIYIGNNTLYVFAMLLSVLAGILWYVSKSKIKAICAGCGSAMERYEYTNGKKGWYDGAVFICKECKTKFIDYVPTNKPLT